ncbi:hypothetical protein MKI79_10645 [Acinetobacter sp. A3.8]|uniref:Uncharacterized protein n=1 Tax=Acinetobacter sedimenti TaxID=2919922 RepID=A0A9X1WYA1_9GAMM|nr:hypothetical protein [Acinetobacter sedimenti]MCJ8147344.1 hypothetical protein [Acinetobacter sedimenti]
MQVKNLFGVSVFIILATILGVALAIFVFRHFSIYVLFIKPSCKNVPAV